MTNLTDTARRLHGHTRPRRIRRWATRTGIVAIALAMSGAIGAGTAHAGATCGQFTVDDGSWVYMPWQCAANATIQDAEAEAVDKAGYEYKWGGESPAEGGFDCSGLVHWAFNHAGKGIPRLTAQGYYDTYTKVAFAYRRPGDLIFYRNGAGAIVHVEIYLGVNGNNNTEETVAARVPRVGNFRLISTMYDSAGNPLPRTAHVGRIVH